MVTKATSAVECQNVWSSRWTLQTICNASTIDSNKIDHLYWNVATNSSSWQARSQISETPRSGLAPATLTHETSSRILWHKHHKTVFGQVLAEQVVFYGYTYHTRIFMH